MDTIKEYQFEEAECSGNWETEQRKKTKKIKEGTSKPSLKKGYFLNKTTQTSRAANNTSNSNFIANIPQWRKAISTDWTEHG